MTSFTSPGEHPRDFAQSRWQGGCGMRWRPFEIAAVVIGFAMWWPMGLAALAYTMARRRGYAMDGLFAKAQDAFRAGPFGPARRQWQPFATGGSGNSAFDAWREAEMAKLEEERRKLDAAHKAFAEHLDNLRRARDREEFESFMAARREGSSAA